MAVSVGGDDERAGRGLGEAGEVGLVSLVLVI
jgi:hypothetical protein